MPQIVLTRITTTSLFKPPTQAAVGAFLFLLWDTTAVPEQLPLDETWAASGAPPAPGYYVFLNTAPADPNAADFESQLRALLPSAAPTASSFVWVEYSPGGPPGTNVKILFTVPVSLDAEERPRVAADVVVPLPPGVIAIVFGGGTLVLPSADAQGSLQALTFTYPSLPGAQPPTGAGVTVPLAGAGVGCLRFDGLISLPGDGGAGADNAVKALVNVQRDPLNPFDPTRNFTTLTGRSYVLSHDQSGYHLAPAP